MSGEPPCSSIVHCAAAADMVKSVFALHCYWTESCRARRSCFWDRFHKLAQRNLPKEKSDRQLDLLGGKP